METREVPDPRAGLEPELIFIPGGWFIMGSDKRQDPEADDHELPQHEVYVGDYNIARYPITNVEYARFVAETGHRSPEHWNGPAPPPDRAGHPVVGVSWHDANAYCAWLAQATRRPYRLPSEAEWEKAARGTDGRIYPWGNTFDSSRCNSWESWPGQVRTTTPVDRYSSGASPYGVMDMAGNVSEWCHSLVKPYPYRPKDGREDPHVEDLRVVRGGSFDISVWTVRCACRTANLPVVRLMARGFRVVVAP